MITDFPSHLPSYLLMDDLKRLQLIGSRWQSFIHFPTKQRLNKAMQQQVQDFFQKKQGYADAAEFKKVWTFIGADKIWDTATPLTLGTLRQIDDFVKAKINYHGPGIKTPDATCRPPPVNVTVSTVVQALIHGGSLPRHILNTDTAKAIFVTKDENLLQAFRQELQYELDALVAKPPQNKAEERIWRAFLGHIVALLPLTYPHENEIFSIPVLSDGICRRVDYKIHVMPLTVTSLSSPMTALGLTPQNDEKAPPYLTYLPTTYPAGDGYAGTLLADFSPFYSVGESVYIRNHAQIDAWLAGKEKCVRYRLESWRGYGASYAAASC